MGKDYLYEDSAPFMQGLFANGFNPWIFSFGKEVFQSPKIISTAARLVGAWPLAYQVTLEPKNEFIARQYPGHRGVLVDDVSGQNLPTGFTEININRNTNTPVPISIDGGFAVSGLAQALEVIQGLVKGG